MMVASASLASLMVGMGMIALVLFVHETTGSFGSAGAVAGAFAAAAGVCAPFWARLIDRLGSKRVLTATGLVSPLALSCVVPLGESGAGAVFMAAAAGMGGVALPPVAAVTRRCWSLLVPAEDLPVAYALDSVLGELIFVLGSVLAGLLVAVSGPGTALLIGTASGLTGGIWFSRVATIAPAGQRPETMRRAGALRSPTIFLLVVIGAPIGASFGVLDLTFPAFGVTHGHSGLGGPLNATLSIGSALGGVAYGVLHSGAGSQSRAYIRLASGQVLSSLPLFMVTTTPEMFAAALTAGLCVAPLLTVRSQIAEKFSPQGSETETFSWLNLSVIGGFSAGSVLAGLLIEAGGWRAGAAAAIVLPLTGLIAAFAWRRLLG